MLYVLNLFFATVAAPPAHACAALVTRDGGPLATSDAQQVLLDATDPAHVAVEYRNQYMGTATGLGWIVVVPGPVSAVLDGDPDRFDALEALSQPTVRTYSADSSESSGCRNAKDGSSVALSGGPDRANELSIVAQGFTGTYSYTVVDAADGEALSAWLTDADFALGANGPALSEYADEGGFQFVLVDLSVGTPLESGQRGELPPLRIETDSDALLFPARMARDAAPETQHTIVYVLGDDGAAITGAWDQVDLNPIDAESSTPEAAYEQALWDVAGDSATYARVYSGESEDGWVTRFETLSSRQAHADDVTFALGSGKRSHSTVIEQWSRQVSGAAMLGGLLMLAGVGRRRLA